MTPPTPKPIPPTAQPPLLRCPRCNGTDVVASMPRGFMDELMRGWHKVPKQCRSCGKRFYLRETAEAASDRQ